jgi:hypothetical protein
MFWKARRTRLLTLAPLFAALALAAACGDDDDEDDEGADQADLIVSMNLIVGNQAISISRSGTATPSTPIIMQTSVPISATFVNSAGNVIAGLNDFELRVTSDNTARFTFTRVSAFQGTLNRIAAGTTTLRVGLWHTTEGHFDFGEFTIPINVQ